MTSERGVHQRRLQLMRPVLRASREACAVQLPARSLQLVSAPQAQLLYPSHCSCSQQECHKSQALYGHLLVALKQVCLGTTQHN